MFGFSRVCLFIYLKFKTKREYGQYFSNRSIQMKQIFGPVHTQETGDLIHRFMREN